MIAKFSIPSPSSLRLEFFAWYKCDGCVKLVFSFVSGSILITCQPLRSFDFDVPGICSRFFGKIASLVDARFSFIVNRRTFFSYAKLNSK
jgi:hypothetical protein